MSQMTDVSLPKAANVAADVFDTMFAAPVQESSVSEPAGYKSADLPSWAEGVERGKERLYPKASWLDAMTLAEDDDGNEAAWHRIALVNSDENGLYRMFIGVSP